MKTPIHCLLLLLATLAGSSQAALILTINGEPAMPTQPGGNCYQMQWSDYLGVYAGGAYDALGLMATKNENTRWAQQDHLVGDDITRHFRGFFEYVSLENGMFPDLVFDYLRVTPYPSAAFPGEVRIYSILDASQPTYELFASVQVVPEPGMCALLVFAAVITHSRRQARHLV